MVKGKTIEQALQVGNSDVVEELGGLPNIKMHCSVLGEEGIAAAARDYFEQHPDKTPPAILADKIKRLEAAEAHEHGEH